MSEIEDMEVRGSAEREQERGDPSHLAVPAERRTSPATESSSLTPTRRISPSISESCGCSLGPGSAERHCGSVSPVVGVDMGHGARPDDAEVPSDT